MPSIPVSSTTQPNTTVQRSMRDTVEQNSAQIEVLQKGGTNTDPSSIIVQTVTNGDADHAPSGDAVFDFVTDAVGDVLAVTVTDGDTTHAPTGNAVFDYVEAKRLTATASLNFPNVVAFTKQDLTITVTGAATGDAVALGAPAAINAGFIWSGWVSAADTVTVRVYNLTGVDINPAAQTWRATVFK